MAEPYRFSPASEQPDIFGAFQSAAANQLALRKSKQEMADFFARREAMRGFANEPVPGAEDYQRSNAMRNLYAATPEAAYELEQRQLAPEIAARKAGGIETAKREADAKISERMLQRIMGSFDGGTVGGGGQTVGGGVGVKPTVRITEKGVPTFEFDQYKAQEAGAAQELALHNRISTARAGAAKAQEDFKNGIITEPEMIGRIQEYKADAESSAQELQSYLQGGAPATPAAPQQAQVASAIPMAAEVPAAPAPAPRLPSQAAPAAPAPAGRGIKTKAAEEEARRAKEATEADARVRQAEDRKAYATNAFEPALKGGGNRPALLAAKLPRLMELQNKNQYGDPLLKADLFKMGLLQSSSEALEFDQGVKSLVQSFIQPGTSGSVNTVAEMGLLSQALAGLEMSPAGNVGTLVALSNAAANDKAKLPFYTAAQKKGMPFQEAASMWQDYMDSGAGSAYVSQEQHKPNKMVEYHGVKNPDYIPAKDWLSGKRPKAQPADRAAQIKSLKEKY